MDRKVMPDNYLTGYWDEARLRGIPDPVTSTAVPNLRFDGTIGQNHVQIYGNGGQLTPEQAINQLNDSELTQFANRIGATPPAQYAALNPSATPQQLADYKKLYDSYQRGTLGGGAFGIRAWLRDHPVGTIAAFVALAYGGALAAGYGGTAAGGAGSTPELAAANPGLGAGVDLGAAVDASVGAPVVGGSGAAGGAAGGIAGFGGAGTGGSAANLATDLSGVQMGGGAAGNLAASGGITGGAGVGGTTGGSLGGAANLVGGGGSMGWGDWVNLAGQLYGAYTQHEGAKDASRAAAAGDAAAIAEQRRQFDTILGLTKPYRDVGNQALGELATTFGYTPPSGEGINVPSGGYPNFMTSPDYQFKRNEGVRDIGNYFGARGGAASGNALRRLAEYNSDLASQEFGNYFNRRAALAGIGQTATGQGVGAALNTGTNVSNLLSQQGANRASGIEGETNALTGGINDFLAWYNRRYGGT
jgi:hypothetical protein